ncbi:transcriptional regulator, XRE family [Pyrolobus fumarii 1A]|uniref:Transcriptional regulator, XRE family n=1 Tax=Pyrolobus fumarii (strain DSM 11204 / 1A) TaxID=694429 RepID=G0EEJ1_PYRF1|nr:CBS domain-containing protein [Pyrolobus fumarii]AEM38032.1 transcriptional regulator, XRE family [Pyrolobus fumarii 1A]
MNKIGEEIRRLRLAAGLSQRELARLAGVSQSLIAKIEAGKVNPRVETLKKILDALEAVLRRLDRVEAYASKPVITVRVDEPVRKAVVVMDRYGFSQVPVVDEKGRVVGTVIESSVLRAIIERGSQVLDEPIERVMVEPLPTVKPDEPVMRVLPLLERYPAVLVVDDENRPIGIVTKIDLIRGLSRSPIGGLQWNQRGG